MHGRPAARAQIAFRLNCACNNKETARRAIVRPCPPPTCIVPPNRSPETILNIPLRSRNESRAKSPATFVVITARIYYFRPRKYVASPYRFGRPRAHKLRNATENRSPTNNRPRRICSLVERRRRTGRYWNVDGPSVLANVARPKR